MKTVALLLACALAGCVTAQQTVTSHSLSPVKPMTVKERSAIYAKQMGLPHELPDRVADIAQRLIDVNRDHCQTRCDLPISFWPGSSSQTLYYEIQIGGWAADSTNGKLAHNIGHELAHVILGHTSASQQAFTGGTKREEDADCLRAVMATRGGFEVESAADAYLALASRTENKLSDWASRYAPRHVHAEIVRTAGQKTRALMAAGKSIDKAAIKEICGVSF